MAPGTWFMLAIAVIALVLALLPGQVSWRLLSAWAYRNPESNEPSQAAHTVRRLSFLFGAVVLGVIWFQLQGGSLDFGSTANKLRDTVDTAAEDLDQETHTRRTDKVENDSHEPLVSAAVRRAAPSSLSVQIEHSGSEHYTITAKGTDEAYCLSIREGDSEPVDDYADMGEAGEAIAERVERVRLSASVRESAC